MPTPIPHGSLAPLGLCALLAALTAAAPAAAPATAAAPHPAPAAAPSPATAGDPWAWLSKVRLSLAEAGPTSATFTQTYVPAGFTSGEKETGALSLHLPDCLRWDYRDPYPRGFLLCGEMVHAWNPEDHTGRRYRIDRRNEPGLDLLLLGVDDLQARYSAVAHLQPAAPGSGGHPAAWQLALTPKNKAGQLTDAALVINPSTLRVTEVSYHDREGNLTRFQIGDYHPLTASGQFAPPANVRWEESP